MNRPLRILVGTVVLLSLALVSCDRRTPSAGLPVPVTVPGSAPAAPSQPAMPTSFQEVTAQLDPGGSFYLYLSTQQWVAGLSQQIATARESILNAAANTPANKADPTETARVYDLFTDLVARSGIEDVTGVGMSSFALAPQVTRGKFFVHHAAGKGTGFLWALTGEKPHPLDALQLLPAQTALASFHDWDPTLLQQAIAQGIDRLGTPEMKAGYTQAQAQVASILGMSLEEALRSMKGTAGLLITLDPAKQVNFPGQEGLTIPTPGLALVFHVADERIFNQLDKTFGTGPQLVRVDEPGLKMRTLADIPVQLPFAARPTAAMWGQYFILATTDQLVRDIIAAKGAGLATTPEFREMATDMPTVGNGFQVLTKLFSETMAKAQSEMLKAQPTTTVTQAQMMQKIFAQNAGASSFAVSSHLENGWLTTAKTKTSGDRKSMFANLLTAMAGAVGTPAVVPALEGGQAAESQVHARQIYAACVQYAADNAGRFPPSLEALAPRYVTDPKVFVSPFAPAQPQGYKYTAGLTQDSPAATVLLEDREATTQKKRIVVHVDGSSETASVP